MKKSTFNQSIRSFIDDTEAYVCLPDMNQSEGYWYEPVTGPDEDSPDCCFGARIARALIPPDTYRDGLFWDHSWGMNQVDLRLSHIEHLSDILYVCGTGVINPFSSETWKNPPHIVYERLKLVERDLNSGELQTILQIQDKYRTDHINPLEHPLIMEIYKNICKPIK